MKVNIQTNKTRHHQQEFSYPNHTYKDHTNPRLSGVDLIVGLWDFERISIEKWATYAFTF